MRKVLLVLAAGLMAGCSTTTAANDPSPNTCTANDSARLSGLRTGAKMAGGWDRSTEKGRKILDETDYLAAKCDPPQASATPTPKPPPA